MPEQPASTRAKILNNAYELFYREGFARVSMDAVAAAAGVTKRTVYYHFDSKDDLAAAVLDQQNRLALEHIGSWDDGTAETAASFVTGMFDQLESWAASPRWLGSGFTRLTMELAELSGHPTRISAMRHKKALENWLCRRLADFGLGDAKQVARQVLVLIEGAMALTLIHRDTAYIASAGKAAVKLCGPG